MKASTENKAIYWLFFLVVLLTSIPYLVGFASQTGEWRFSGFLVGVDDGNSYIAKMLRGSMGDWLFRSPYSAMEQEGLLVFLPYLLLGKLAAPPATHTQLVVLFHLFRIIGLAIYMAGINRFVRLFDLTPLSRLMAIFLATVGGGTGWILLFFQRSLPGDGIPLEFNSPETFGFLSVFSLPHLAAATGLLFLALEKYLRAFSQPLENRISSPILAQGGLFIFLTGFFQLIDVAIGLFLVGIILLTKLIQEKFHLRDFWNEGKGVFLSLLPALGWVVYVLVVSATDPYLKGWNAQNTIRSPHPVYYIASLGILYIFLAINYTRMRVAIYSLQNILLLIWCISVPVLVYLPLGIQRRLAVGVWVGLVILVLMTIQKLPFRLQKFITAILILLSLPSTVLLWISSFNAARTRSTPVFVPTNYVKAYEFLGSTKQGNILTVFRTGNELPAWQAGTVTLGLGPESVPYAEMQRLADEFYGGDASSEELINLMNQYQIQYAIWGNREKDLYPTGTSNLPFSKEIFANGSVRVLEIKP
jgi:hypothetical protein